MKYSETKRKRRDRSVLTSQQADEGEHTLSPHSESESKTGVDGGKQGVKGRENVSYGPVLAVMERKQARQQSSEPNSDTREEEGSEQKETAGCENVIDKQLAKLHDMNGQSRDVVT